MPSRKRLQDEAEHAGRHQLRDDDEEIEDAHVQAHGLGRHDCRRQWRKGIDRIEAHAKPTPTIDSSSQWDRDEQQRMTSAECRRARRLIRWVHRRPSVRTMKGSTIAASAAKPL